MLHEKDLRGQDLKQRECLGRMRDKTWSYRKGGERMALIPEEFLVNSSGPVKSHTPKPR